MQTILRTVADQLEAHPVVDDERVLVQLNSVEFALEAGGISMKCEFNAHLRFKLTSKAHIDPHIRGSFVFPVAPLWVEGGIAHFQVRLRSSSLYYYATAYHSYSVVVI
jgi:hypothetical protein